MVVIPGATGTGGAERSLLVTAPYYAAAGISLCVVVFADYATDVEALHAAGAEVIDLSAAGGRLGVLRSLRRLVRQRRPDLLHTVLYDADLLGRLAAWGSGTPVLSSIVAVPPVLDGSATWRARLARALDRFTARWACDHFHAVTPGVRSAAIQRLGLRPERVTVVERGRDPVLLGRASDERRARTRAALGLGPDAPVVVAAGRHYPLKDHVTLVRAVGLLQADRPDLVLVLAGDRGPTTDAIEAARAATADPTRIVVLGHRSDVADVMAAADVFVSPSISEGAAGAVIEALGIGVPIVSTDVEGLVGQVRDGSELLLVPVGDPPSMAAAIGRLLDDPTLAAGLVERGRLRFEESFELEANARRLVTLSTQVADRSVPGRWGAAKGRPTG